MLKKKVLAGRIRPRDERAHLITAEDVQEARELTARLSLPGRAKVGDVKVTVPPKRARMFWR